MSEIIFKEFSFVQAISLVSFEVYIEVCFHGSDKPQRLTKVEAIWMTIQKSGGKVRI